MDYLEAPANAATAPRLERRETERGVELIARSNGSPACFGGWRVQVPVKGGTGAHFEVMAECRDVDFPLEVVGGTVLWSETGRARRADAVG